MEAWPDVDSPLDATETLSNSLEGIENAPMSLRNAFSNVRVNLITVNAALTPSGSGGMVISQSSRHNRTRVAGYEPHAFLHRDRFVNMTFPSRVHFIDDNRFLIKSRPHLFHVEQAATSSTSDVWLRVEGGVLVGEPFYDRSNDDWIFTLEPLTEELDNSKLFGIKRKEEQT